MPGRSSQNTRIQEYKKGPTMAGILPARSTNSQSLRVGDVLLAGLSKAGCDPDLGGCAKIIELMKISCGI